MLLYDSRFSQPMAWTLGLLIGTTVITNPAIAVTPIESTQDASQVVIHIDSTIRIASRSIP